MEHKAAKEAYPNVDDFRLSKLKTERGWRILMLGIAIEVLTASGLELKAVVEKMQTKANIENLEPRRLNLQRCAS
jgi:hypothetical protein